MRDVLWEGMVCTLERVVGEGYVLITKPTGKREVVRQVEIQAVGRRSAAVCPRCEEWELCGETKTRSSPDGLRIFGGLADGKRVQVAHDQFTVQYVEPLPISLPSSDHPPQVEMPLNSVIYHRRKLAHLAHIGPWYIEDCLTSDATGMEPPMWFPAVESAP